MVYVVTSLIVFVLLAVLIPNHRSGLVVYGATMTVMVVETIMRIFIVFRYNLVVFFEKGIDLSGLLFSDGIFPLLCIIYLKVFPFGRGLRHQAVCLVCTVVFCMLYERGALWTGTLYYNGWEWWYSMLLYLLVWVTLPLVYIWLRRRLATDHAH